MTDSQALLSPVVRDEGEFTPTLYCTRWYVLAVGSLIAGMIRIYMCICLDIRY